MLKRYGERQRIPPQPWETSDRHYPFARIYTDLLHSDAFCDMSSRQQILYVNIAAQRYGAKYRPCKDFPNASEFRDDENPAFYFNFALASEKCRLYSKNGRKEFYADMRSLKEHGFITEVANGRANHTKSIYRYSAKWRTWKPPRV